jgi:hypothetical protein
MFRHWVRFIARLTPPDDPPGDETTCPEERKRHEAKKREIDARLSHLRYRANLVQRKHDREDRHGHD